jgi:hypothetical protein
MFPFEQRRDFYLAWKDYGWIHTQKLIKTMQKLLKDKGVSFRVLVFPVSDQVNDRYRRVNKQYVLYPQSMISKICDSYEIPVLDLTDSIYINGGITLFRDYLHLNGKGNDVVVDELEQYLVNEIGLIERIKGDGPRATNSGDSILIKILNSYKLGVLSPDLPLC